VAASEEVGSEATEGVVVTMAATMAAMEGAAAEAARVLEAVEARMQAVGSAMGAMEDAVSVVEVARVQEAWRRRRKVVGSEAAVTVVVHKQYTTCTNHTPRAQPYTTHTQSY